MFFRKHCPSLTRERSRDSKSLGEGRKGGGEGGVGGGGGVERARGS